MANKIIILKDTSFNHVDRTRDFYTHFFDALHWHDLLQQVQVVRAADMGIYDQGIVIRILPENIVYHNVTEEDIERIIERSVEADEVIDDLVYRYEPKQVRIVLRNSGLIDPENIEDYIQAGGYRGLRKALGEMNRDGVISEMKKSGLRGRGGAGYPTWLKWEQCHSTESDERYIICNADEGDPGAYMDRNILESDPHSVIEGMIIGGYAVGATRGFFYIRAEYPLAIQRIQQGLAQCLENGFLGDNILGSGFSFSIEVRLGAGAFVCGEETALIASIEGRRGTPVPRPPYPTSRGLWGKPTAINNVETLANVPYILDKGGEAFSKVGTPQSTGTKVFAITGKIKNSGLIEVPMGITLNEIVYDICGGTISEKKVKAVQTGGPSGGVIPADHMDVHVDYENLHHLGSIMGSGGMIIMDEDDCMVDIARFYLGFCVDESCGRCAPCRIGGYQSLTILNRICHGQGVEEDIDALRRISTAMQKASLCGLGQNAPNPVVSTLKFFEKEYHEHIDEKRCKSGKCRSLAVYVIDAEKCKKCGLCASNCPQKVISGNREDGFVIDREKCISCGVCAEVCKFNAVAME